ncbi:MULTISPECIES: molybdopterin-dependent oxidoreductase [unclassified Methylobacterium]|uniref:molybdopterin-dependent oxidoreductase n=1 Tax=unclassified Methylobacterium TaxID=2615210 RepID=UPI0011C20069|nr:MULTISPECIES: molybdopterin-dependent oxidoreductase [unclassified Methylobacterium]QEE39418.1 molybdopterin-dependent oxidoreductase [Methylobacterium sp. WL1]TXN56989.1 molybdopterin-dependent oxidoreductase [Methylobacterium sp. WL2]
MILHRRKLLTAGAGLAGTALLGGCDRFAGTETGRRTLKVGEDANLFVQRLLMSPATLAREYPAAMISPWFKPNGTIDPPDRDFRALAAKKFADFKLTVDGLVQTPLSLSLADLRGLPARTQITRHDCVEGWSCIGQWSGVPLAELVTRAGLKPQARYAVFHCADTLEYAGGGLEGGDGASLWRPEHPGSVRDGMIQLAAAEDWGGAPPKADKGTDDKGTDDWGQGAPEPEAPEDKRTPIRYYESIDLFDAVNPQTILAYDLNGKPLPVSNGAPLRLRVERQLGYKQAKYVMRVELVDSLAGFGQGSGGYWEDRGYEWYAGI